MELYVAVVELEAGEAPENESPTIVYVGDDMERAIRQVARAQGYVETWRDGKAVATLVIDAKPPEPSESDTVVEALEAGGFEVTVTSPRKPWTTSDRLRHQRVDDARRVLGLGSEPPSEADPFVPPAVFEAADEVARVRPLTREAHDDWIRGWLADSYSRTVATELKKTFEGRVGGMSGGPSSAMLPPDIIPETPSRAPTTLPPEPPEAELFDDLVRPRLVDLEREAHDQLWRDHATPELRLLHEARPEDFQQVPPPVEGFEQVIRKGPNLFGCVAREGASRGTSGDVWSREALEGLRERPGVTVREVDGKLEAWVKVAQRPGGDR